MSNVPKRWNELRSGPSGELILAVDWPSAEPRGPKLDDMASLLGNQYIVWHTSARNGNITWDASAEEYARPWLQEIYDSSLVVRAVLARGVGGVLAAAISEMVAQRQMHFPQLLLIDPELVDADLVYEEFLALLPDTPLSAEDEKDVERLRERGAALTAESGDDPAALAARLYALLTEAGPGRRTPKPDAGLADNALARRAEARLSELALADRTDVTRLWDRGTALCSSSAERGLNRTRASLLLPEAALVGREITFAIDHTRILKDAAVARTVSELIGT